MKFEEMLPALRAGHQVVEKTWEPGMFMFNDNGVLMVSCIAIVVPLWVAYVDVLNGDFEINPKKPNCEVLED